MSHEPIIIATEEDAWAALDGILSGHLQISDERDISFDGWPNLSIHLQGRESAISPSMMEAFVELQRSIYRSHALFKYGSPDLRLLTDQEKSDLELEVKVTEGSSNYDINLQELISQFGGEVVAKMEPMHIVVALIGAGLIFAGRSIWLKHIEVKAAAREREIASEDIRAALDTFKNNSQEETARMRILAEALSREPRLYGVRQQADNSRDEILKAITDEGEVEVMGIPLDGEIASELLKRERKASKKVRFVGRYNILRVDAASSDGFRVSLRNLDTGEQLVAGVEDLLISGEKRRIIQEAEWAKAPILATIDAFKIGHNYTKAIIRDVEQLVGTDDPMQE